ncbi:9514_t:CDS:2, partial [Dentiscutata heterogama]
MIVEKNGKINKVEKCISDDKVPTKIDNTNKIPTNKKLKDECKIWMKKVDKLRNMVSKLNRFKMDKRGAFSYYQESVNLNHTCNFWMEKVDEFKKIIKNDISEIKKKDTYLNDYRKLRSPAELQDFDKPAHSNEMFNPGGKSNKF